MKLETVIQIRAAGDYCSLNKTPSGNLQINTISIKPSEVAAFCAALQEAAAQMFPPQAEPKPEVV